MGEDPPTPGTDGYPPGTDGYPVGDDPPTPGTDGYPPGTDGYPSDPPTSSKPWVRPSAGSAGVEPDEGGRKGGRKPYWAGYESPEAFFDHIEAERAKIHRYMEPRPRRRHIPAPDFPGDDEIAGSEAFAGSRAAVRQVGVKLRPVDYDLLAKAAGLCGVAPSTLARILVRRGAQAIVNREGAGGKNRGGEGGEGAGGEAG
jgi:hypothetical protein